MKYLLVGNRASVYKRMLELNCEFSEIFAVKNSFLEKELKSLGYSYKLIENKRRLIEDINNVEFDCLVSNGCPYILPVSDMKRENQIYINIHPSLLPDLKGKHPINGAVLFNRKHGVTCHYMDDGIDTGEIIANIEIPITQDIELGLLYQLSFIAEGEVFKRAHNQGFKMKKFESDTIIPIYYSRKEEDLLITQDNTLNEAIKKIRAFGIPSLCARFYKDKIEYKILSAKIIENDIFEILFNKTDNDQVVCSFENNVVVKLNKKYIQFNMVNAAGINVSGEFFGFKFNEELEDNNE